MVSALRVALSDRRGGALPPGARAPPAAHALPAPAPRSRPPHPRRRPVPAGGSAARGRAERASGSSWGASSLPRRAGLQGASRQCPAPEERSPRPLPRRRPLPPPEPRDMSRKRQGLVPDPFGLKRRRERGQAEADPLRGESGKRGGPGPGWERAAARRGDRSLRPGSARAAVAELVQLFPRGLFEDALPPIALRSQVYSLLPDRTAADRQLVSGVGAADGSRARPRRRATGP